MPYTDEYLDTKKKMMASAEREQNAQDTLDNERAMGRLAPRSKERSPEQVIADQQQEALALIRARPEYKQEFANQKRSGGGNESPIGLATEEFSKESWYEPTAQAARDQRRMMVGGEANLEDAYAQTVGNLIGGRLLTLSSSRPSLADTMSSASSLFSPMGIKTPNVYAQEARPDDVRRLARLEAYFEGSPAYKNGGLVPPNRSNFPNSPSSKYANEMRQDYETPRIKMLEPQKK
jgi:hypothetical protein